MNFEKKKSDWVEMHVLIKQRKKNNKLLIKWYSPNQTIKKTINGVELK